MNKISKSSEGLSQAAVRPLVEKVARLARESELGKLRDLLETHPLRARHFKSQGGVAGLLGCCREVPVADYLARRFAFASSACPECRPTLLGRYCEGDYAALVRWACEHHFAAPEAAVADGLPICLRRGNIALAAYLLGDGLAALGGLPRQKELLDANLARLYEETCAGGNEEALLWLSGVAPPPRTLSALALLAAAVGGRGATRFLTDAVLPGLPTGETDPRRVEEIFGAACRGGDALAARAIFEIYRLPGSLRPASIFNDACRSGSVELVGWLIERFGLSKAEAMADQCWAFAGLVCEEGALGVMRLLAERFELTLEDVSAHDSWVLRHLAAYGTTEALVWFVGRFKPSRGALLAKRGWVLRKMCLKGRSLAWLHENFTLEIGDFRQTDKWGLTAVHYAAAGKDPALLDWLDANFRLRIADFELPASSDHTYRSLYSPRSLEWLAAKWKTLAKVLSKG